MTNETKKVEKVENLKDTYPGMPWDEFLSTTQKCGFKIGYINEFYSLPHPMTKFEDKEKKEVILFNKGRGLLLYAIFSNSDKLKSANLYGEVIVKTKSNPLAFASFIGHHFKIGKWHESFNLKVTSGLIEALTVICSQFYTSCKVWSKESVLTPYFLTEDEKSSSKYEEIINRKIAVSDPVVRKIIGR